MSKHDQAQALRLDHLLTLRGVEDLEDALRPYLRGLMSHAWRPPARNSPRAHYANRPGWWWRAQLIGWSGALRTRRLGNPEVLLGFTQYIRHCTEEEVCALVRGLVEQEGIQESA